MTRAPKGDDTAETQESLAPPAVNEKGEPACTGKCLHIAYGTLDSITAIGTVVGMVLTPNSSVGFEVFQMLFFLSLPAFLMFLVMCHSDGLLMRRLYSGWLLIKFIVKAVALPFVALLMNREFLQTPVCAFVL